MVPLATVVGAPNELPVGVPTLPKVLTVREPPVMFTGPVKVLAVLLRVIRPPFAVTPPLPEMLPPTVRLPLLSTKPPKFEILPVTFSPPPEPDKVRRLPLALRLPMYKLVLLVAVNVKLEPSVVLPVERERTSVWFCESMLRLPFNV